MTVIHRVKNDNCQGLQDSLLQNFKKGQIKVVLDVFVNCVISKYV